MSCVTRASQKLYIHIYTNTYTHIHICYTHTRKKQWSKCKMLTFGKSGEESTEMFFFIFCNFSVSQRFFKNKKVLKIKYRKMHRLSFNYFWTKRDVHTCSYTHRSFLGIRKLLGIVFTSGSLGVWGRREWTFHCIQLTPEQLGG